MRNIKLHSHDWSLLCHNSNVDRTTVYYERRQWVSSMSINRILLRETYLLLTVGYGKAKDSPLVWSVPYSCPEFPATQEDLHTWFSSYTTKSDCVACWWHWDLSTPKLPVWAYSYLSSLPDTLLHDEVRAVISFWVIPWGEWFGEFFFPSSVCLGQMHPRLGEPRRSEYTKAIIRCPIRAWTTEILCHTLINQMLQIGWGGS